MKTTLFAAGLAATMASVLAQDNASACLPTNSSGFPDLDAPCNALALIEIECLYGPAAGLALFYNIESDPDGGVNKRQSSNFTEADPDPAEQDFVSQRDCVCSSQFFQLAVACDNCFVKHALAPESAFANGTQVFASASSSYCAASSTPTMDLMDFLTNAVPGGDSPEDPEGTSTSTISTASDPYSGNTAVSIYYTPAVTGSALWAVPSETILSTMVTESSAIVLASVAGVKTSNGQIVPTANAALAASSSSMTTGSVSGSPSGSTAKPSSSPHTGGAAAPTQAVAAAGMLGFVAAAIALL